MRKENTGHLASHTVHHHMHPPHHTPPHHNSTTSTTPDILGISQAARRLVRGNCGVGWCVYAARTKHPPHHYLLHAPPQWHPSPPQHQVPIIQGCTACLIDPVAVAWRSEAQKLPYLLSTCLSWGLDAMMPVCVCVCSAVAGRVVLYYARWDRWEGH